MIAFINVLLGALSVIGAAVILWVAFADTPETYIGEKGLEEEDLHTDYDFMYRKAA